MCSPYYTMLFSYICSLLRLLFCKGVLISLLLIKDEGKVFSCAGEIFDLIWRVCSKVLVWLVKGKMIVL